MCLYRGNEMAEEQNGLTHIDKGEPAPRIESLMRAFERMAQYEEEVKAGKRVPWMVQEAAEAKAALAKRRLKQAARRKAKKLPDDVDNKSMPSTE
jgi:hypothetical protein